MTNRDILNALGDIDESYITEANGRIKSKKERAVRKSRWTSSFRRSSRRIRVSFRGR